MQIQIERGELKKTQKGKDYTNLQGSDHSWYNVMGDLTGLIGRTIEMDPKPFGMGMWSQEFTVLQSDVPLPETPSANGTMNGRITGSGKVGWRTYLEAYTQARATVALGTEISPAEASIICKMLIAVAHKDVDLSALENDLMDGKGETEGDTGREDDIPF